MKLLNTLVVCLLLVACKQESKPYLPGHGRYDNYTIVIPTSVHISDLRDIDVDGGNHCLFWFTVQYKYRHDTFTVPLQFQNSWSDSAVSDMWKGLQQKKISDLRVMLINGHLDNVFIKGSNPNPVANTVQLVTPLRIIWTRADGVITE